MSVVTEGRRRPDLEIGKLHADLQAGDYWRVVVEDEDGVRPMNVVEESNLTGGVWRVIVPMSYGTAIGTLVLHTVREHDDGTISVRPNDGSSNSIAVTGHHDERWHGYIEHGVFTGDD